MQTSGMVTVKWLFDRYDKLVEVGALKPLRFGAIVYESEGHYKDILSAIMQGLPIPQIVVGRVKAGETERYSIVSGMFILCSLLNFRAESGGMSAEHVSKVLSYSVNLTVLDTMTPQRLAEVSKLLAEVLIW
jgi:hypothetical protein